MTPVQDGYIIGIKYAIAIAKLAQEYDKPVEYIIETLEDRLNSEEKN